MTWIAILVLFSLTSDSETVWHSEPSSRASKPPVHGRRQQYRRSGSDPVLQSGDQMYASTAVKKAMVICCHQRIEKLIWTNQNVRHGFQFTISADEDEEDYTPPTAIR